MALIRGFVQRTIGDLLRPELRKQWIWVFGFIIIVVANLLINIQYLKTNYPAPRPTTRPAPRPHPTK